MLCHVVTNAAATTAVVADVVVVAFLLLLLSLAGRLMHFAVFISILLNSIIIYWWQYFLLLIYNFSSLSSRHRRLPLANDICLTYGLNSSETLHIVAAYPFIVLASNILQMWLVILVCRSDGLPFSRYYLVYFVGFACLSVMYDFYLDFF